MIRFIVFLIASSVSVSLAQLKTEDYKGMPLGESEQEITESKEPQVDEATLKALLKDLQKSKAAIDERNKRLEKIMEEMDE